MKLAEAVVSAQPEIPLTIFQNGLDGVIRQAILRRASRESPPASVQLIEAVSGTNPQISLAVLQNSIHSVVAQAVGVLGVGAIHGEPFRLGVKPIQSRMSRQPQDSSTVLE